MKIWMKLRVISVPAFVLEVVLFWIIWFIRGYAWVNSHDVVSDVLNIVLIVGLIIIIVSAVLTIIQLNRDFSTDSSIPAVKKIVLVIVFIAFIGIHSFMYFSYSDVGYSTSGLFNITNKQVIEDSNYFYIKSSDDSHIVEIECTKEIYDELIIDENVAYTFTYRCLTYDDDKGVLEGSIDTKDIIDNRR